MEKINVTKSFLPPYEVYTEYLKQIWESHWLTNHGPLTTRLEADLKAHLGVKHLFFVNNGTIALQIAIKALDLKPGDEVITTPFSYVATTSSIVWEGCVPVFADIDPETLCLDPKSVERVITPRTRAIMAVHVYGNPCEIDALERVAQKHNLKIIYDAAHAFGVEYVPGVSVLTHGDISTLSFHATKLFHTAEGGAIVTENDELAHKISYLRNFGHNGPEAFYGLGVNGKCSEFHAAMGLSVLPHVDEIVAARKRHSLQYDALLAGISQITRPRIPATVRYNYSYYPVLIESEELLLHIRDELVAEGITPRRYFYPSLTSLPYVNAVSMPVSEDASRRALCLPLYFDLSADDINRIAGIVSAAISSHSKKAVNF